MSTAEAIKTTSLEDVDLAVLAGAGLLHGPVDILSTLSAKGLESNPVVLALGWRSWLLAKVGIVLAFAAAWAVLATDEETLPIARVAAAVALAFGAALVAPNLAIIAGGGL